MSDGGREAVRADDDVVPASEARRLEERVRELERQLGRKTMEVEILKEALDLARSKKPTLRLNSAPGGGYVRVNPVPDAATAIAAIDGWITDYNEVHPHSRLGFRSPREYIRANVQPAACPV